MCVGEFGDMLCRRGSGGQTRVSLCTGKRCNCQGFCPAMEHTFAKEYYTFNFHDLPMHGMIIV